MKLLKYLCNSFIGQSGFASSSKFFVIEVGKEIHFTFFSFTRNECNLSPSSYIVDSNLI